MGVVGIDVLNVFGEGAPPCFECGVALAVDFAGLNDVGAVCEDVPVLDVRGYCSSVRGTGLAASADARASAEYEEQLMGGVVLAVAEALAEEGEEVLLAAVFAPPQAARNRGQG